MFEIKGKYTIAKVMIDFVEPECISQIVEMTNHPIFSNPIAIMPDTHSGKGSVIGFTMKLGDKIIPNIVGVDIGCGMLSVNVGFLDINHEELDKKIRERVPFGFNIRNKACELSKIISTDKFKNLYKRIGIDEGYALRSLGTLGGGNHFIELGRESGLLNDLWITVHTGSRNLGKKVCEYWQKRAVDNLKDKSLGTFVDGMNKIKDTFPKSQWSVEIKKLKDLHNMGIKTNGMEFLTGSDLDGYVNDMTMAQEFAQWNRLAIINEILEILSVKPIDTIETVHNFIDPMDRIVRKGAIRSYVGERSIIPFNPHDGLLICEGKSNPEWNFSAPHGAGRVLSRSQAKKVITVEMAKEAMEGVYSSAQPLDESPLVYKDSALIEKCIEPTVTILKKIKPIHNMKDSEGERE